MSEEKEQKDIADTETEQPAVVLLEWITHPMKKRPVAAVLVSAFIILIPLMVLYISQSKWFAMLSMIVLFASVAKFYFPTKFILTDRDVTVKGSTQTITKKWSEFRSFYPDKNGVLLSPFIGPSRLENFRGLYLICNDNRQMVIDCIKKYVKMDSDEGTQG